MTRWTEFRNILLVSPAVCTCVVGVVVEKKSNARDLVLSAKFQGRASRQTMGPRRADTGMKFCTVDQQPFVQHAGGVFSKDTIVDLIRDDLGNLQFVSRDGGRISVSPRIRVYGQVFIPPTFNKDVLKGIRFPPKPQPYQSTQKLFSDLHRLISMHSGLHSEGVWAVTFFSIATWFADVLPLVPCLCVAAPDISGRNLFFGLLDCLCRRPLRVVEPTRGEILSLPLSLHPTIIVDSARPSRQIQRLLGAMTQPRSLVSRNGQLRDVCCPTVICFAEPLTDPLLLDAAIHITLMPHHAAMAEIEQVQDDKFAQRLQARLLRYRLENFREVRRSKFDVSGLRPASRDLAFALGACIIGNDELQRRVVQLIGAQDQGARARNLTAIFSVVIEAALALCHDAERASARAGEIADAANVILHARGETAQLEARSVGNLLRSAGLFTEELGNAGRGLLLLREMKRKIHSLALAHGIESTEDVANGCEFCLELRATRT